MRMPPYSGGGYLSTRRNRGQGYRRRQRSVSGSRRGGDNGIPRLPVKILIGTSSERQRTGVRQMTNGPEIGIEGDHCKSEATGTGGGHQPAPHLRGLLEDGD